jgi:CBS domain containing-hemolysin-like protein
MITAIVVLFAGLVLAAVAATIGVSAATVSQLELTRWVQYKLRGAGAAAHLRDNPGRVLATANALTTIGLIVAAAALPALLAATTGTFLAIVTVTLGVPFFMSAAYLVPRVVGRRYAEPVVARAVPWMDRVGRVLAPVLPRRDPSTRTTLAAVLVGAETHVLASSDEMAVVSGVLAFADRPVRELMTPRTSIVAIPEGMLAAEAAHVFTQSGYSRYPVYRGTIDQIVGVVHSFDLLRLSPDAPVTVRPSLLVQGTMRAADLMLEMQRGRGHLAVVLDEFGGTAGLVTFDDLLKNLVREVFDEAPAAGPVAEEAAGGVRLVELEGNAPAARLAEELGVAVLARDVRTVGGLLILALGRIPRAGERFQLRGLEFDILAATATKVERVLVRRAPVRTVALDRPEEPGA